MANGELTEEEKARVNSAVAAVEVTTGLEFCVIIGSKPQADARHEAERAFHQLGMHERPAIMIMVVPHARTLEIVTANELGARLTNDHCDAAITMMTSVFTAGDIVGGIEQGVAKLAEFAGPRTDGRTGHETIDLPNVLDLDDPDLK